MKTQRRWIATLLAESRKPETVMPWHRKARSLARDMRAGTGAETTTAARLPRARQA